MDAAKLQEALDYGSSQASFAVRVYRHGCLVGEDRFAPSNRGTQYESYSMAKSVTSMMFGRAMTLGLISPDDLVGALVPEADRPHGAISMRDLLTMTSGLRWNGFRDYNVFTMPDRVRDALTLEVVRKRGTYFEYAQSAVALLAEAVGRSAGEDAHAFVQRQLMDPLGIPVDAWRWERDKAGHVQGFYGVNMRPDDFGRLGELLRRGGVWRGRRLLSQDYVRTAVAPTRTNGCYGWLIWINAGAPCVGPTIGSRPVEPGRMFPDLPADLYSFSGLFGQRVTVFPSLGLLVVRTGQDPDMPFFGDASNYGPQWEHGLYTRVLAAVTDERIVPPGKPRNYGDQQEADYGFQTSLLEPDQYSQGVQQQELPPAGPRRARAAQLRLGRGRASVHGKVFVLLACPARWPGSKPHGCEGRAKLEGAKRSVPYDVAPGKTKRLRFRLTAKRLRALRRAGKAALDVVATNSDAGGGARSATELTVKRPR